MSLFNTHPQGEGREKGRGGGRGSAGPRFTPIGLPRSVGRFRTPYQRNGLKRGPALPLPPPLPLSPPLASALHPLTPSHSDPALLSALSKAPPAPAERVAPPPTPRRLLMTPALPVVKCPGVPRNQNLLMPFVLPALCRSHCTAG